MKNIFKGAIAYGITVFVGVIAWKSGADLYDKYVRNPDERTKAKDKLKGMFKFKRKNESDSE